jgi:hypothetical protein
MITAAPNADTARWMLAAAHSPKVDASGRAGVDEIIGAGHPFVVCSDGQPVAAYVLQAMRKAGANVLWITAAAGRASLDLTATLTRLIERQARVAQFDAIGFRTERRGLVRKAARHGYEVERQDGNQYFLRKQITP